MLEQISQHRAITGKSKMRPVKFDNLDAIFGGLPD
jgi:hypothetical protein